MVTAVAALCALLAHALPAPGADIHWSPSFEDALGSARESQRVVFVALNMDGERANDLLARETYHDKTIVKLAGSTVGVVGSVFEHVAGDRVCPRFGTVSCRAHRAVEATVRKRLLNEDGSKEIVAPQHFFLAPSGEVLLSVPYAIDAGELEWCLVTAIRKLDPGFEWKLSSTARAPKRLVMDGLPPDVVMEVDPPPTRAETLELLDLLKRNTLKGADRGRAVKRVMMADEEEARDFVHGLLRGGGGRGGGQDTRLGLLMDIGAVSPPSYWEIAADFVDSGELELRRRAVVALEQLGAPESLKTLRTALVREKDPAVEKDLLRALASAGATDAKTRTQLLKRVAKEDDPLLRVNAIVALGHLAPDAEINETLNALLEKGASDARIAAVCAAAMTREPQWKPVFERLARDADDEELVRAAKAASTTHEKGLLRPLRGVLMEVCGDELPRERFFGRGEGS